jgi:hypothetical protein
LPMQTKVARLLITGSVSLRCFFVVWVLASSADVPPVKQAGMPKFVVKSMPMVPATAEVLPIELDGISDLKVEVLSPTPEPMVRFMATEDRLGPPSMLTATVRRVKLTGFWLPSPAPALLTTAFKMLEVVEPDNEEEGRVRPLPPLIDKAGRGIPRGLTLPKDKVSAVELAEMPELQEDTELAKTQKLNEVDKLVETPVLNKGGVLAEKPKLDKGNKLARMPKLDKRSKLARTPELKEGSKLARTPELNEGSELARTPELDEGSKLAEKPKLNKGNKLAKTPELNKGSKLARRHELNKGSKLAEKPELDKGNKLARTPKLDKGSKLARTPELDKANKLARMPELDKGSKLDKTPKLLWVFTFAAVVWITPLPPQLPATSFGIVAPINLRPMAAMGILPGDVVIALAFTATAAVAVAASTFGGGG